MAIEELEEEIRRTPGVISYSNDGAELTVLVEPATDADRVEALVSSLAAAAGLRLRVRVLGGVRAVAGSAARSPLRRAAVVSTGLVAMTAVAAFALSPLSDGRGPRVPDQLADGPAPESRVLDERPRQRGSMLEPGGGTPPSTSTGDAQPAMDPHLVASPPVPVPGADALALLPAPIEPSSLQAIPAGGGVVHAAPPAVPLGPPAAAQPASTTGAPGSTTGAPGSTTSDPTATTEPTTTTEPTATTVPTTTTVPTPTTEPPTTEPPATEPPAAHPGVAATREGEVGRSGEESAPAPAPQGPTSADHGHKYGHEHLRHDGHDHGRDASPPPGAHSPGRQHDDEPGRRTHW